MRRLIIIFFLLFNVNSYAVASTLVKAVRAWPSPDNVRIVFDLTAKSQYKIFTLSNPNRIVIDFNKAKLATKINNLNFKNTSITSIRSGYHRDDKLRIVLELNQKVKFKAFALQPNERYGYRLVVDVVNRINRNILALPKNKFIIAIDPGHGGEDPGAIGPRGTKEKDIVLSIAKYLQKIINKEQGMQAVLTRKGDYYVRLRERMQIARKSNADLFISIHADGFKSQSPDGASVFILSNKGATSEAARWLAEAENKSDTIGGVSLDDKSDLLASVLLDLSQTANKKASIEAANYVLRSLGKTAKLHRLHVERAGFMVLKAPDVPSMLIETGFISNPRTEKNLRNKIYQQKLARSIMDGVVKYFAGKSNKNKFYYEK